METEKIIVRYHYHNGPGREYLRGALLEVNCQAWAHWVLDKHYGIRLPSWLLSQEAFEDEHFLKTLHASEPLKAGDIFLFGPNNLTDTKRLHWAVFTGFFAKESNEPILEHANVRDKTVGLWLLSDFQHESRYERLYAIKRPQGS